MKKLNFFVMSIIFVLVTVCLSFIAYTEANKSVPKEIRISENRIVNSDLMTEKEKQLLDRNLKQNENVLLLYYETNEEVSEEKEKLIVGNYTKEEFPYVIFEYNPSKQTLKTVSSDNEILEFADISIENVTSYTEIYKYISEIESKMVVPYISQHKADIIYYIFITCMSFVCTCLYIIIFLRKLKYCICWKRQYGFMYKESFWEKGYKVKFDPNDKKIIAMYTNVPIKKGKDYLYIPKNDKRKNNRDTILLETADYYCKYIASELYDVGFFRLLNWKKKCSIDSCVIEELKLEYKYKIGIQDNN